MPVEIEIKEAINAEIEELKTADKKIEEEYEKRVITLEILKEQIELYIQVAKDKESLNKLTKAQTEIKYARNFNEYARNNEQELLKYKLIFLGAIKTEDLLIGWQTIKNNEKDTKNQTYQNKKEVLEFITQKVTFERSILKHYEKAEKEAKSTKESEKIREALEAYEQFKKNKEDSEINHNISYKSEEKAKEYLKNVDYSNPIFKSNEQLLKEKNQKLTTTVEELTKKLEEKNQLETELGGKIIGNKIIVEKLIERNKEVTEANQNWEKTKKSTRRNKTSVSRSKPRTKQKK